MSTSSCNTVGLTLVFRSNIRIRMIWRPPRYHARLTGYASILRLSDFPRIVTVIALLWPLTVLSISIIIRGA